MNKKIFLSGIVIALFSGLVLVNPVLADYRSDLQQQLNAAAGSDGANFGDAIDPRIAAAILIRRLLTLMGTLILAYMVWSGFLWMTAAGDQAKVDKAKKSISRTVIGLIIILSSYSITLFASRLVQLRDGPANRDTLIHRIKECVQDSNCPNNGNCSNHICSNGPVRCNNNNECPIGAVCRNFEKDTQKRCYDITNQVQQIDVEQRDFLNPDPLNQDTTPFVF